MNRTMTIAEMDAISATSTLENPELVICQFCGGQVLRTVWVNTFIGAVKLSDSCSECD